jgi:hypothetical protein
MALDNGEAGGEFLGRDYWLGLGREGALVVFRILRIEDPVLLRADLKKEAEPVVVDFVVLNGSEEGTVYRAERVIAGGIVNTLRTKTVEDPKTKKKRKVARQPGDDVAVRMGTFPAFGRDHPGANPCGPDEFEKVKDVFGKTDGDPYTFYEKRAMAGLANDAEASSVPEDDDLPF